MKKISIVIKIIVISVGVFFATKGGVASCMDWNQVNKESALNRFENLHHKYDSKYKRDGDWFSSAKSNHDIEQLNFLRWLFKNNHESELISVEDFNSNAGAYDEMISTWKVLVSTGRFTSSDHSNQFRKYSGTNVNIKNLEPIKYDKNLQQFVNSEVKFKNKITHKTNDNRVNLGIHEPSKEKNLIKKSSGNDAKFNEVLYSGHAGNKIRPCIEQFLIGYIIDDDNNYISEEGAHRWLLLSNNKFAASAFTQEHGNIINFAYRPVTLTLKQQLDNTKILNSLSKLGQNKTAIVLYDTKNTNTPWINTHYVGFISSNINKLLNSSSRNLIIKINNVKYRIRSISDRFSWKGTGIMLPTEIFMNVMRIR